MLASKRERERKRERYKYIMLQNQHTYTVFEKLGGPRRQGAEKLELAQVSVPVSVAGAPECIAN